MRNFAAGVAGACALVVASGCSSMPSSPSSPSSAAEFKAAGTVTEAPPGFSALADARVEIVAGSNLHTTVTTDSAGAFTFGTLPGGNYTFKVTRDGYVDLDKTVTLNRNMSVAILLYPLPPPNATARCKDRSWSYATDKAIACVPRHGGVAYFVCPGPLCESRGTTGS